MKRPMYMRWSDAPKAAPIARSEAARLLRDARRTPAHFKLCHRAGTTIMTFQRYTVKALITRDPSAQP